MTPPGKHQKTVSVGIDSMVLIYAGHVPSKAGTRSPEFEDLSVRARLLLHQLTRQKATILLPTIAVSELLVPVPQAEKGTLIVRLTKMLVCPPFDLEAAAIAADLWSRHKQTPKDQQYGARQVLRADTMIVASALAAGATEFYSHDRRLLALAKLVMTAHDLPTDDPEDMFLKHDIRRGDV